MKFNVIEEEISNKSEFERLFGDEFFIIDSNNLDRVNEKLYGFVVGKHKIFFNHNNLNDENLTGDGTYLYLKVTENEITIYQDFKGSFGLYIYDDGNYFAISNSFLKLVEFLKNTHNLTFNMDYAKSFIVTDLCSHMYKETLVNEITIIPRNYIIHIDKFKKDIKYEILDFFEDSIELDSIEGLNILDNWFYKWIDIIRFIKENTNNVIFDLSGGFDSRLSFIFALCSNIDLDKVKINSNYGGHERFNKDYEIASEIANAFNFMLNKEVISVKKIPFKDMFTTLMLSFYHRLGFSNQMTHYFFKFNAPVFHIGGGYGETLREWHRETPEEFMGDFERRCKLYDANFAEPVKRVINSSFDELQNDFGIEDENSKELTDLMFSEGRFRNHFGKLSSLGYFINSISITPLADTNLRKLKRKTKSCDDDNLLMAVIFSRYCPDLLNFKFDSNKEINEKTIMKAEEINKINPFIRKDLNFISGPDINYDDIDEKKFNYTFYRKDINNYLINLFHSRLFEMEFKKYFTNELYNKVSYKIRNKTYFPLQHAFAIFSALKIINDVGFNPIKQEDNLNEWLNNFEEFDLDNDDSINPQNMDLILKYATCRLDIINKGDKNNNVEILYCSDNHIHLFRPDWLKKDTGQGLFLTSTCSPFKLSIRCIGDGELNITLRSEDVRDKNDNRYPIYIDYNKFSVDDLELFKGHKVISHDSPFHFKKFVKNSELINIHLEWAPFNNSCEYKF